MTKGYDDPVIATRDQKRALMVVTMDQYQRGYAVRAEDGTITHHPFTLVWTTPYNAAVVHAPQHQESR